jgi:hypothetical protein
MRAEEDSQVLFSGRKGDVADKNGHGGLRMKVDGTGA